jgi:hypothetical protein
MKIYEENLNFDHTNYSFIHAFNTQIKREFTEYYDFIATRHFWSSLKSHFTMF